MGMVAPAAKVGGPQQVPAEDGSSGFAIRARLAASKPAAASRVGSGADAQLYDSEGEDDDGLRAQLSGPGRALQPSSAPTLPLPLPATPPAARATRFTELSATQVRVTSARAEGPPSLTHLRRAGVDTPARPLQDGYELPEQDQDEAAELPATRTQRSGRTDRELRAAMTAKAATPWADAYSNPALDAAAGAAAWRQNTAVPLQAAAVAPPAAGELYDRLEGEEWAERTQTDDERSLAPAVTPSKPAPVPQPPSAAAAATEATEDRPAPAWLASPLSPPFQLPILPVAREDLPPAAPAVPPPEQLLPIVQPVAEQTQAPPAVNGAAGRFEQLAHAQARAQAELMAAQAEAQQARAAASAAAPEPQPVQPWQTETDKEHDGDYDIEEVAASAEEEPQPLCAAPICPSPPPLIQAPHDSIAEALAITPTPPTSAAEAEAEDVSEAAYDAEVALVMQPLDSPTIPEVALPAAFAPAPASSRPRPIFDLSADPELQAFEREAFAAAEAAAAAADSALRAREAAKVARATAEARKRVAPTAPIFVPLMPEESSEEEEEEDWTETASERASYIEAAAAVPSELPPAPVVSESEQAARKATIQAKMERLEELQLRARAKQQSLQAWQSALPALNVAVRPSPAILAELAASAGSPSYATETPPFATSAAMPPLMSLGEQVVSLRFGTCAEGAPPVVAAPEVSPCVEYSLTMLPDGRCVSSGGGSVAHVWDAAGSGRCALELKGHTARVWCVAASPQRGLVVTGSWDGSLRVWSATRGVCVAVLRGHGDRVWALATLPDSELLVSASWDATCRVWSLDSLTQSSPAADGGAGRGAAVAALQGHSGAVLALCPLPRQRCATGGADGAVRVWLARSGACERTLCGHGGPVCALAAFPDGLCLASGSHDATVRLWSLHDDASQQQPQQQQQPPRVLSGHEDTVTALLALPDGRLASAGADATLRLWTLPAGDALGAEGRPRVLAAHRGAVTALALSGDGASLVSGDTLNTMCTWNLASGTLQRLQTGSASAGHFAACGGAASCGRWAFALPPGVPGIASLKADGGGALRLRFQSEGDGAAAPGSPRLPPGSPRAADAHTSGLQPAAGAAPPPGFAHSVHGVLLLADGRVATAGDDSNVQLWTPTAATPAAAAPPVTLGGHSARVWAMAELPARRQLLTGSWDGALRLWHLADGACCAVLQGHTDRVWTLTLLNHSTAVSGSWDGTLRVWTLPSDPQEGLPVSQPWCAFVLDGHAGAKLWAAAALGHRHLASGAADGSLAVWDCVTGTLLHALRQHAHSGPVSALAALGAGRLLSGGWDGTLRVWHAQRGDCERILASKGGKITALAPLGLGRAAAASSDGTIRVWDVAQGELLQELRDHCGWVTLLLALPDGGLASSGADNCLRVWQPLTGVCTRVVAAPGLGEVPALAMAGAGSRLSSGRWCFTLPMDATQVTCVSAL